MHQNVMMAEPDREPSAAEENGSESDGSRLVHGAGRSLHDLVTEDGASCSVTSRIHSRYSKRWLLNLRGFHHVGSHMPP